MSDFNLMIQKFIDDSKHIKYIDQVYSFPTNYPDFTAKYKVIGIGCNRIVFEIDSYVIKVNYKLGRSRLYDQNRTECEFYEYLMNHRTDLLEYFVPILAHSDNFKYVIAKKVEVYLGNEHMIEESRVHEFHDILYSKLGGYVINDLHDFNIGLTESCSLVVIDYGLFESGLIKPNKNFLSRVKSKVLALID